MPYKVSYRLNALQNVRQAKNWYRQQRQGLQKEFSASVKEAISDMISHPEAFAVRYRNIRIAHTTRFPYSIHFYIDAGQKQIVITNILHDSRYFPTE